MYEKIFTKKKNNVNKLLRKFAEGEQGTCSFITGRHSAHFAVYGKVK
jgi:hypothetical protein